MNLTESRLRLNDPDLTPDQRALLRCHIASELTHAGRYEAAREALGEMWRGIGNRPETKGLSILTTAEVLLQCGVLSGWLGSVRPTPGAQEQAKDLISEALRTFQAQEQRAKVSEAQYELSRCYFRLGSYDDARVILEQAFDGLSEGDAELKAKISIRRASVEIWTGRYYEARRILENAKSIFDGANDVLRGKWHGQMGLVFRRLATTEGKSDYFDNAIIEYTAAIHYYELARHERYRATNLNNLAFLLYKIGHYGDAHEQLDRAVKVLTRLRDEGLLAQVSETRARVFVAERRYGEASRVIAGAVMTLEKVGEPALLADALSIQSAVYARLGEYPASIKAIRRAVTTATEAGATSNAGLALLTLIEEHGAARLSYSDVYKAYRRADDLLKETQDAEEIARLRACARIVAARLHGAGFGDKGFSLPKTVLEYEAKFIEQALEMEQGSVSRAAKRLGIKYQSLAHMLRTKHRKLLNKRTPPVPRRRSIIKKK